MTKPPEDLAPQSAPPRQHLLYLRPLPQGQGSFLPVLMLRDRADESYRKDFTDTADGMPLTALSALASAFQGIVEHDPETECSAAGLDCDPEPL